MDDFLDIETALQDAIDAADLFDDGIDLIAEDYMILRRQPPAIRATDAHA